MGNNFYIEILVISFLIMVNALMAMAETAIISCRKTRLKELSDNGSRGAAQALKLADTPESLLSTVQICITLIGIVSGVFGGASLAYRLNGVLQEAGLSIQLSEIFSYGIVVVTITYFSIVIGELVPKKLAINNAETVAILLAPLLGLLIKILKPAIQILNFSTTLMVKLLGLNNQDTSSLSEEEIKIIIKDGEAAGVIQEIEGTIVSQILKVSDRKILYLITPRHEVNWLDYNMTNQEVLAEVTKSNHTYYPVADKVLDSTKHVINSKKLWALIADPSIDWKSFLQPALIIAETVSVSKTIELLKEESQHFAVVFDEHGTCKGILTLNDISETIIGDIKEPDEVHEAEYVTRTDGSLLVSGWMNLQDLFDLLELDKAELGKYDFTSVAGYVIYKHGGIPNPGDSFVTSHYRFEVLDLDGNRVDKILVEKLEAVASE